MNFAQFNHFKKFPESLLSYDVYVFSNESEITNSLKSEFGKNIFLSILFRLYLCAKFTSKYLHN